VHNVTSIIPSNDFSNSADAAKKEIVCGLILGYDEDGLFCIYSGGLLDGKRPTCKDWLWMVSCFKQDLIRGDFSDERN
jgi:hypothetical protein